MAVVSFVLSNQHETINLFSFVNPVSSLGASPREEVMNDPLVLNGGKQPVTTDFRRRNG